MAADMKRALNVGSLARFLAKLDAKFAAASGAMPSGGDAGQVLVKASAADYDAAWSSAHGASYAGMTASELSAGTSTDAKVVSPKVISDYVSGEIDTALGVVANGSY